MVITMMPQDGEERRKQIVVRKTNGRESIGDEVVADRWREVTGFEERKRNQHNKSLIFIYMYLKSLFHYWVLVALGNLTPWTIRDQTRGILSKWRVLM